MFKLWILSLGILSSLAHAETVTKEFNHLGETLEVVGDIKPLSGVDGIQIDDLVIYYQGSKYYLGDKYPYAQDSQKLICKLFGYSYSRPQYDGAWLFQTGIYFEPDQISTENLSTSSYVRTLYCASARIPE